VRRTFAFLAAASVASLALTACGSSSSNSAAPSTSSSSQSLQGGGSIQPTTWPLDGLPAANGGVEPHPVYIVKVDNTADSDPQIGFSKADMVVEELVEGGITRLASFFYSQLPTQVGPVRSMRLTDIGISEPVKAQLVASGAAPQTISGLVSAGVKFWNMDNNDAVVRDYNGTHDYLHSVMANLPKLAAEHKIAPTRPADYFTFGSESDWDGPLPATNLSVHMSSYRTSNFHYADGKYTLTDNYFKTGDAFTPATVIICRVTTSLASYTDPAGNPVPISHFVGSGQAAIFHDGTGVRGTWHKQGTDGHITFTTKAGKLDVPPGKVWVELVPPGGSYTFTK
jgi:hypothetical protein